ncbi:hypothetical protein PF006_g29291 [Phytophthora fragariae]|uniref:Uncharacterized protein n=1 Tax=Phytophthora fragariae TaxID=53985 RepID=A0A6A3Q7Q6_9STRA|nr:hypothetical protein PF006_g29291 [Phytophthora fragariae]
MVLNLPRVQSSGEEDATPVRVDWQLIRRVWHERWETFETVLHEYQRTTNQLFRVRSSTPSETRNKTIKAKEVWSTDELLPEGIDPNYKKFECTHAKDHRARGVFVPTPHTSLCFPARVSSTVLQLDSHQLPGFLVSRHQRKEDM